MCKVQILRALVAKRLTEAADEIVGIFESTITEYENELRRSREENEWQRQMLDALLKPTVCIQEVQQPTVKKEEITPEPDDWPAEVHEETEPCNIKVEKIWSIQEGESRTNAGDEVEPSCVDPEPGQDPRQPEPQTDILTATETRQPHPEASRPHSRSVSSDSSHRVPPSNHDSPGHVKRFRCGDCGKTYTTGGALKRHTMSHSGEKPYACTVCGWKSSRKCALVLHMMRHTGEKPHRCSLCGRRFRHTSSLSKHACLYAKGNPFPCSVCGAVFPRKSALASHRKTHNTEPGHSCSVCGKKVTNASYLAMHMRIHK
ncbi:uncharacterized protein LOC144071280 [Stigmatopora argus]